MAYALLFGMGLASASWAATPLESQEAFTHLPISEGRAVKYVGEASTDSLSEVLPGTPATVIRAVARLFSQAPTRYADSNAIGSAVLPDLGAFNLYRGHDLGAPFWQDLARSSKISALVKGLVQGTEGEGLFYLRSEAGNLWQTREYSYRGAPVWMRCDFIILVSAVKDGARVELLELASLLPGRRLGLNAHTMMPSFLFDWREAPLQTNRERQLLLDMIRRQWNDLPTQDTASPWTARIVARDAFRERLSVLLATQKLHLEAAQILFRTTAENKELVLSYQVANDDDEALVFPVGTTLRQAIQVWRGLEPLSPNAGMAAGWRPWGLAFPLGWSQAIPELPQLQAHERVKVVDHISLRNFHPGSYRVHMALPTGGQVIFSKSTDIGLSFDLE